MELGLGARLGSPPSGHEKNFLGLFLGRDEFVSQFSAARGRASVEHCRIFCFFVFLFMHYIVNVLLVDWASQRGLSNSSRCQAIKIIPFIFIRNINFTWRPTLLRIVTNL